MLNYDAFLCWCACALTHLLFFQTKQPTDNKKKIKYKNFICSSLMLFMIFCVNMNVYFYPTSNKEQRISPVFFLLLQKTTHSGATMVSFVI